MRRAAIAIAAILAGLAVLVHYQPTEPVYRSNYDKFYSCPFSGEETGGTTRKVLWTVFMSSLDDLGLGARVQPEFLGQECRINITKLPTAPFTAVDWRIGHAVEDIGAYRGKRVRVAFVLSADRSLSFDAASVYSYDGRLVSSVDVRHLDENVSTFEWMHDVPDDAARFEVWLRLTIHGGISRTGRVDLKGVKVAVVHE